MPAQIKPIKRSVYLAPLSREHHEGLLLVWKIKAGLSKGVSFERIIDYCSWFFSEHLVEHFKTEESEFANVLDADNSLLLRMHNEHKTIKAAMGLLSPKNKNCHEDLLEFASIINRHIRFEERVLFNFVETVATKLQLERLHESLKDHKLPEWKDSFWLSLKPIK